MMPNLKVCIDNEINGVFFDTSAIDNAKFEILKKIDECKEELAKAWNVQTTFPFTSTVELGKLFKKLGCPSVGERTAN